jgi:hypothetical protein
LHLVRVLINPPLIAILARLECRVSRDLRKLQLLPNDGIRAIEFGSHQILPLLWHQHTVPYGFVPLAGTNMTVPLPPSSIL